MHFPSKYVVVNLHTLYIHTCTCTIVVISLAPTSTSLARTSSSTLTSSILRYHLERGPVYSLRTTASFPVRAPTRRRVACVRVELTGKNKLLFGREQPFCSLDFLLLIVDTVRDEFLYTYTCRTYIVLGIDICFCVQKMYLPGYMHKHPHISKSSLITPIIFLFPYEIRLLIRV